MSFIELLVIILTSIFSAFCIGFLFPYLRDRYVYKRICKVMGEYAADAQTNNNLDERDRFLKLQDKFHVKYKERGLFDDWDELES